MFNAKITIRDVICVCLGVLIILILSIGNSRYESDRRTVDRTKEMYAWLAANSNDVEMLKKVNEIDFYAGRVKPDSIRVLIMNVDKLDSAILNVTKWAMENRCPYGLSFVPLKDGLTSR